MESNFQGLWAPDRPAPVPWCWCPWPCQHVWCSVNVYHCGLGDLCIGSSGVCPCSCISPLRPLPPGSWTSMVLEADLCGPALIPVAHPVTARSLSFLEPHVHGAIAAPQGCGEREWRLRLTHTATRVPTQHPRTTQPHTLTPTPPASMHALTPMHTLCTHTHTRVHSGTHMPSPTHTHTDTTHSLTLTRRGTGPDREHPSKPQAGPGRLPLSAVAVSNLVP